MALFGQTNAATPSRLFGYPAQFSCFGRPIPLIYGTNRIAPVVIWFGDWTVTNGGGKFGTGKGASGKSGAQQFNYQSAVQMALCQGPIKGLGRIFVDKAVLAVARYQETITVPSGGGIVTPGGVAGNIGDLGVSKSLAYSHVANDYGSPGAKTLSGTQQKPMTATTGTPSAGQYQLVGVVSAIYPVSRGSGYTDGANVVIDPPPSGGTQATSIAVVSGPATLLPGLVTSYVVTDGGSGYTAVPGVTVTPVTPGKGSGATAIAQLSNSYNFSSADSGSTVTIYYQYVEVTTSESIDQIVPSQNLQMILFNGEPGQAPWGYLTSNHPSQALGYTNVAHADNPSLNLGSSGLISSYNFEVQGLMPGGSPPGTQDVEPSTVLKDVLTNPLYGCGFLPSEVGDLTEVMSYNFANGLFVSPVMDSQQPMREYLTEWIEKVSNAAPVWSDGMLKLRSYGDKTVIGNGYTFTPSTTPIYDVDDDNLLTPSGPEEPVIVNRPSVREADNQVTVEWANRGNGYNYEPVTENDDGAVRMYGLRTKAPESLHCITSQPVAVAVAITMLRRSVWVRNQYEFSLDAVSFALVEPMDMLTIADLGLGLVDHPVRVLSLEEDDNFRYKVLAEDFPWSAASPTLFPKQTASNPGPGYYAAPGSVNEPQFVQLPTKVTQGNEYVLGIALSGGPNWGGAEVFYSTSGETGSYKSVGRQVSAKATPGSTMGALTALLPPSADPNTTDTLSVNLTESFGLLETFTKPQANALVSLIAVDDELMAYETATLTAAFNYDVTYLRRGAYGTNNSNHAVGAQFCVVDDNLFQFVYDESVVGTTVWFKFCSFNQAGQREENIANVTAYPYFVAGPRTCYPWSPAYAIPFAGDAYYPDGAFSYSSFGIRPVYQVDAKGNGTANFAVEGNPPVNVISPLVGPPTLVSVVVGTGGNIPAGQYVVTVTAYDSSAVSGFGETECSNEITVTIPSPGGSLSVTASFEGTNYGGDVYFAVGARANGWHFQSHITAGQTNAVIADLLLSTDGGVDTLFDRFGIEEWPIAHGGVLGDEIALSGVTPTTLEISGAAFTVNQFAGCVVSLYAHFDLTKDVELANFVIASNTENTLTIGPNSKSVMPPDLTTIFSPLDVIVIRMKPTFTANGFSDANLVNCFAPAGLDPPEEPGRIAVVLTGPDAGDWQTIASATSTSFTLAGSWVVQPNDGDLVIVLDPKPTPLYQGGSVRTPNRAAFSGTVAVPNVINVAGGSTFIRVLTLAADGTHGPDQLAPWREGYTFGFGRQRYIVESSIQLIIDGTVTADTTAKNQSIAYQCLPAKQVPNEIVTVVKVPGDANLVSIIPAAGETFWDGSVVIVLSDADPVAQILFNQA